jgi:hypothetical protein
MQTELNHLRMALSEMHPRLIEAEAELTDRLAEVNAFEFEFEARVGHLIDALEALERELHRYNERIHIARNKQRFGYAHISVEEQYRRTWQSPPASAPTPPPTPVSPANEAEIKRLYRHLARRFHPDLAVDEQERTARTKKMQLINEAYAARSLTELVVLMQQTEALIDTNQTRPDQSETQLVEALQAELQRCQNRLREIEKELGQIPYRASVQVSLEVKAAQRQGRDLLAEMAAELERRIARKTIERDMLKAQFDQLGPEQGFIPLDRKDLS